MAKKKIKKAPVEEQVHFLRNSERKAYKRCPAHWWWRHNEGLVPVVEKPDALWFGSGLHLVWEHWYGPLGKKRGKNPLRVWRDYVGDKASNFYEEGEDGDLIMVDALTLGEAMIGGYLDKYGRDENWHILAVEEPIRVKIALDGANVDYIGKLDIVARNEEDGSNYLWDHKHVKRIDTQYLALDDQAGSYHALAARSLIAKGLLKKGTKLDGILFNFLRKAMPDDRPVDENGYATNQPLKAHYEAALAAAGLSPVGTLPTLKQRAEDAGMVVLGDISKRQPSPLFHRELVWRTPAEQNTQIRRIVNDATTIELTRERRIPVLKNPTAECRWCPFVAMCEMQESGGDWRAFKEVAYKTSDPYTDHR